MKDEYETKVPIDGYINDDDLLNDQFEFKIKEVKRNNSLAEAKQ